MLFVPEINSFIKYLEMRSHFHKDEKDRLRQNIFEANTNTIVFNLDFVNSIEEIIEENHELRDECNLFIKRMIDNIDNVSLNTEIAIGTKNPDIIFEALCKFSMDDKILIGVSESKEKIGKIQKVLNLGNVSTNNKNHVFSKLLTNEVCQIRHTDLNQKSDIIALLNHVYDLYDKFDTVTIIDRQVNLNHNLYNHLITKSPKFNYYTLKANGTDALAIKRKLLNYQIYSTNSLDLIHERALIINCLVITMDEDPYNIEHRDTWSITIEHSKKFTDKILLEKCNNFTKTLFFSN